jgi:PTS system nitrogen regulatory IIA component
MRLGVKDVASLFKVPERTVFRWVDEDGLPVSRVDGQYRFSPAAVFEWATERGMNVPPDLFRDDSNGDRVPLPSVAGALRAGGVIAGVPGNDKKSVLAAVVEHLKLPKEMDRATLLQVMLAREQLGSTGIGEGIAIPHVRNPIVLRVQCPMLTLALLDHPIDYGAVDNRPVHTLFIVISPSTRAHLHILSRLGYVLQDTSVRSAISARAPAAAILGAMEKVEQRLQGPDAVPGKKA